MTPAATGGRGRRPSRAPDPLDTDGQRRADHAGLAKVFAERAGCLPVWREALEGWDVWQSQVIREWKSEAHREGQLQANRSALLKALRARFGAEVPADLTQVIQQPADLEVLSRWYDAAPEAPSLEAFRSVTQPGPVPPQPPTS